LRQLFWGGDTPRGTFVFDEPTKRKTYERINYQPEGKVNLVFLGCPHATLHEIKEISRLIEGKHIAEGTRLWVMTTHSIRASAERLGYAQIIEDSGGELFADGCLATCYLWTDSKAPNLERAATDSVKQALVARRSFSSKLFFGETERCIQTAVEGDV